jgi:hypothetical protein
MEKPGHTFILSDTIARAYLGWMKEDLETSYNLASLALWRSDHHNLWLTHNESTFLSVAIKHPPHKRNNRSRL